MSEPLIVAASSGGTPAAVVTAIVDAAANQIRECAVVGAECGAVQPQSEESN